MIKLVPSPFSVIEKINLLDDLQAKKRCLNAYNYLMASDQSSYKTFVHKRNSEMETNKILHIFNKQETVAIDCALWPNLYPFTNWCESYLTGHESRLSSKISFLAKVFSEVIDYVMHYDLLHFQYDRSMYKVITGAINSGRFFNCSPARALDTKPFSPTYWTWQHLYLIDAVDQFGLPDVFITISPYEWTFPIPSWLSDIRYLTGNKPTELAAFETEHIVHVLEKIVRGYLCGSWSKKMVQFHIQLQSNCGQTKCQNIFLSL